MEAQSTRKQSFFMKHLAFFINLLIFISFAVVYICCFPVFKVTSFTSDDIILFAVWSAIFWLIYLLISLSVFLGLKKSNKRGRLKKVKESKTEEVVEISDEEEKTIIVHANPKLIQAIHFLQAEERGIREKAIELLIQAIEEQDKRAAVLLGLLYERGLIVKKDREKAIEIYNIAIELGSKQAYLLKARLFENKEEDIAIYNARKAAMAGVPEGLNYLGNKYFTTNPTLAKKLYQLSFERGYDDAEYNYVLLTYLKGQTKIPQEYLEKENSK